jgi:ABC-2 type transport system ATP-binding protein
MANASGISVRGLTKIFSGGVKAINGLDLEVKDGEILALLGPNGAGKTTTIRVLSTLSGFDEGQVEVAGYNVDTHPEKVRTTIGVVAQQTGVDYFLTGRENMELQGRLYRMKKSEIDARIQELTTYFEIADALDRLVMTYSGGMRRKLDIATALIHRPKVLFLDEPTLGLDIKSRQNLWRYIEKLNKEQGLTILLTTHYLEEADHLSHRVAIINSGKIQIIDTPEALKNDIHGDAVILAFSSAGPEVGALTFALHELPGVRDVVWENDKLHLYVDNGSESVPTIVRLAGEKGVGIKTLSLAHPTLDDVFLKYTGNSLAEAKDKEEGEEWWQQWAGKGGGGGKWEKNWQKWQTQLEESGDEAQKASWQQQQQQWQAQGSATTETAPTAPVKPESKPAEQQWPQQDGQSWPNQQQWSQDKQQPNQSQNDWQKWQSKDDKN